MELYFEDDLDINNISYNYNIGDVISFWQDEEVYSGIVENISPCYHHNIKYVFYTIKEAESDVRILIEQDKIIENFYPEILLLEIDSEPNKIYDEYFKVAEYKDFSFIIW